MKKILSLVLALVMMISVLACASSPESTQPASSTDSAAAAAPAQQADPKAADPNVKYAEHVTVAIDVLPSSMDPSSNAFPIINRLVYDELINYNKVTEELEPALATAWQWLDEGSTILHLDLREGVTFHNGNPFTAADVEFSLAHNGNANIAGSYDYCDIKGDYSVDVHLKSGAADFVYILTNTLYAAVLDKESCEADPEYGTTVGTGPWVFDLKATMEGDRYEFTRNDNYWGEKPVTASLTLRYIKESPARLIALQNKEIAAYSTVGETDVPIVESDPNLVYCSGKGVGPSKLYFIGFNMKRGAAKDNVYLRQAIACALNRAEIIAAYTDAGAVENDGFWWGNATPYRATQADCAEDLSYNLDKAKELLKKAEEVNGGPFPTLKLLSNYAKTVNSTMCLAVQHELKQIGLDVEIIESDSAGVLSMTKYADPGDFDMIQYNTPLEPWPSAVNRTLVRDSNNNRVFLDSDYVQDLLMKAQASNDDAVRKEAYVAVQVYVHDQAIYIPIYYGSRDGAQLKETEGIVWANDGYPEFTYVRIPE